MNKVDFTKFLATSSGTTSVMSNLKVIVFGLFSISHSTVMPFSTVNTTSLGFRSFDLMRRVFDARFVDEAVDDGVCAPAGTGSPCDC